MSGSPVKPEPIFSNWTSERAIDVPNSLQLIWSAQTGITQRLRKIASLQSVPGSIDEHTAVEFISPDLRKNIHDRAACGGFAHPTQNREVDFLRSRHFRHVR